MYTYVHIHVYEMNANGIKEFFKIAEVAEQFRTNYLK